MNKRMDVTQETNYYICATVKALLCQGSQTLSQCDVTRRQRTMRALVLFTLQRNVRTTMHRTGLLHHSLQLACLKGDLPASGVSSGSIFVISFLPELTVKLV